MTTASSTPQNEALDLAIANAGGIVAFAKAMGISHQAVYSWKRRGYVPIERALQMEALMCAPARALVKQEIAAAIATDAMDLI